MTKRTTKQDKHTTGQVRRDRRGRFMAKPVLSPVLTRTLKAEEADVMAAYHRPLDPQFTSAAKAVLTEMCLEPIGGFGLKCVLDRGHNWPHSITREPRVRERCGDPRCALPYAKHPFIRFSGHGNFTMFQWISAIFKLAGLVIASIFNPKLRNIE